MGLPDPAQNVGIETARLIEIYTGETRDVLIQLKETISPHAVNISTVFYQELLELSETAIFLDNELVSTRLHRSMKGWIEALFLPFSREDVYKYIDRQLQVGEVHARIDIPMRLVNYGIRILKQEFWEKWINSPVKREQLIGGLYLIDELLDFSSTLINQGYVKHRMMYERNSQSLRIHAINYGMAVEMERLKSSLFDWLRKTLTKIYTAPNDEKIEPIYNSEFGLWVFYKASLLFSEFEDMVANLKIRVAMIDEAVTQIEIACASQDMEEVTRQVADLNDLVTQSAWMLSSFVEHARENEAGRDNLTRLFNRRYLPTIMQQVIRTSNNHDMKFAVMLCDIDNFKEINDTLGHDAGDMMLKQFSELLLTNVRANDFVFRLGGDEFLIVLVSVNINMAVHIADKLRKLVESQVFNLKSEFQITISVGVSVYEGHPDYERVISKADKFLHQAKQKGKNQIFWASA